MKIILDDTKVKQALYPFTANRHAADIRIGILTIREKWSYLKRFQVETNSGSFFLDKTSDNNSPMVLTSRIPPPYSTQSGRLASGP